MKTKAYSRTSGTRTVLELPEISLPQEQTRRFLDFCGL